MSINTNLNMLLQKKTEAENRNNTTRADYESQIGSLSSAESTAQTTLDGKQKGLQQAESALANFTVPEVIDQPDRGAFTKTNAETGEEVFDEESFNSENEKYLASVKAHEEAEQKKAELEQGVKTAGGEVEIAETDYSTSVQAKESKQAESDKFNQTAAQEIADLDADIKAAEQEQQTQQTQQPVEQEQDVAKPEIKTVKQKDGTTKTFEINPETGETTKVTITDANGNFVKSQEIDSENSSIMYIQEREGNVTIDEIAEDGKIKSKFATSDSGNVAEYDGHGNTVITVKAGESADVIYNKFYGKSEDNAENRENLIQEFRQKVQKNGQPVASDYNPSEAELKQFYYKISGFEVKNHTTDELFMEMVPEENDRREASGLPPMTEEETQTYMEKHRREVCLANGGVLQAGQKLTIPTEINPDDKDLQNRDAEIEKAKGNQAESKIKAQENALKMQYQSEQAQEKAFRNSLLQDLRNSASAMNSETNALNNQSGSHNTGNIVANYHNEKLQSAIGELDENSSLSSIAGSITMATGNGKGTLSVNVSEQDLKDLYSDIQKLAKDPNNKDLANSVQNRWDSYTMRNFVGKYNESRAENNMMGRFVQSVMIEATTAPVSTVTGALTSAAYSVAQGNTGAAVADDFFAGLLTGGGIVKEVLTDEAKTEVYKKLGNSSNRIKSCLNNLSSLNQQEQKQLAKMLEGKTPEQQAAIMIAYSKH